MNDLLRAMLPDPPPPPVEKPTLKRVHFTHDAIIDEILMNPAISQNELSTKFGYSVGWMSIVINSDAFQERLAARKGELLDPAIKASLEERAAGAAQRALDRILERLDSPAQVGAIKTADLVSIAKLAVAPKTQAPPPQQNLYLVQIPAPASNAQAWLSSVSRPASPPGVVEVIENQPRG
jgi:hypothetical protein